MEVSIIVKPPLDIKIGKPCIMCSVSIISMYVQQGSNISAKMFEGVSDSASDASTHSSLPSLVYSGYGDNIIKNYKKYLRKELYNKPLLGPW